MPLLAREADIFPDDLLEHPLLGEEPDQSWWALYSLPRREKELMRQLGNRSIPFYGPVVSKRGRSPTGRVRTAFVPLCSSYVIVYGNIEARYDSMTTNCVARWVEVPNSRELTRDLRQIRQLILSGLPLVI